MAFRAKSRLPLKSIKEFAAQDGTADDHETTLGIFLAGVVGARGGEGQWALFVLGIAGIDRSANPALLVARLVSDESKSFQGRGLVRRS